MIRNRNVFVACLLLLTSITSQTIAAPFIDTVLIGNPGNAGRPVTPEMTNDTRWFKFGVFGSVAESYRIGTTEVTNDQYVTFLNAIASTDPHSLFNTSMESDPRGGIQRTGTNGNYSYSSKTLFGNKPVNYVSFWDTLRFSNWLHNDMPSGAQDDSSTEDGAYVLGGVTNPPSPVRDVAATRKPGAKWFLPSDDEWFKAAYHKNDGITGNYYEYPTAANDVPTIATANANGDVSNPGSNVVNYRLGAGWNGLTGNLTTVGSTESPSAYGTFDQAGNLDEWNETVITCLSNASGGCNAGPGTEDDFSQVAIIRGGTWRDANDFHIVGIMNSSRDVGGPNGSRNIIGFRVASLAFTADFDSDTDVDGDDLTDPQLGWSARFGTDLDGSDFLAWQRQFGSNINSPLSTLTVTVPEPSSGVLLIGLAAIATCTRRIGRRRRI